MALTDASFLLFWTLAIGLGQRFLERPNSWRAVALGALGRDGSTLQVQRLACGSPRRAERGTRIRFLSPRARTEEGPRHLDLGTICRPGCCNGLLAMVPFRRSTWGLCRPHGASSQLHRRHVFVARSSFYPARRSQDTLGRSRLAVARRSRGLHGHMGCLCRMASGSSGHSEDLASFGIPFHHQCYRVARFSSCFRFPHDEALCSRDFQNRGVAFGRRLARAFSPDPLVSPLRTALVADRGIRLAANGGGICGGVPEIRGEHTGSRPECRSQVAHGPARRSRSHLCARVLRYRPSKPDDKGSNLDLARTNGLAPASLQDHLGRTAPRDRGASALCTAFRDILPFRLDLGAPAAESGSTTRAGRYANLGLARYGDDPARNRCERAVHSIGRPVDPGPGIPDLAEPANSAGHRSVRRR